MVDETGNAEPVGEPAQQLRGYVSSLHDRAGAPSAAAVASDVGVSRATAGTALRTPERATWRTLNGVILELGGNPERAHELWSAAQRTARTVEPPEADRGRLPTAAGEVPAAAVQPAPGEPVGVFVVLRPQGHFLGWYLDEGAAIRRAQAVAGVVVGLPVVADFRATATTGSLAPVVESE